MTDLISLFVDAFFVYIVLGILFSIWFAIAGAKRMDGGVAEAPWHFRLIIIPGAILIWPSLLLKIIRKK